MVPLLSTLHNDINLKVQTTVVNSKQPPKVFLSYSWDDKVHESWVRNFANKLIENGIAVIVDIYDLKPGMNMKLWMENSIEMCDYVIPIYTTNYCDKSNQRIGGAGYEYSIINQDLYENMSNNEKILPILREGTIKDSVPKFMRQYMLLDFSDDGKFDEVLENLLRTLHSEPKFKKPVLGQRPNFQ